jgi:hypothetical protein
MTIHNHDLATSTKDDGFMKRLLNSMWAFWFLLLVVSLGLATVVYYVWLKGNI